VRVRGKTPGMRWIARRPTSDGKLRVITCPYPAKHTDGIIPENDPVDVVRADAEGTAPVFIEALCDTDANP
jgi:hypothetical protein